MTTEEFAVKLQQVDDRSKSNVHRLDEVEKRCDDNEKLVASVAKIAQKQDDMDGDVKEIKADVKNLSEKPGKRWDAVVDKAILLIASAVIGYFLSRAGM